MLELVKEMVDVGKFFTLIRLKMPLPLEIGGNPEKGENHQQGHSQRDQDRSFEGDIFFDDFGHILF